MDDMVIRSKTWFIDKYVSNQLCDIKHLYTTSDLHQSISMVNSTNIGLRKNTGLDGYIHKVYGQYRIECGTYLYNIINDRDGSLIVSEYNKCKHHTKIRGPVIYDMQQRRGGLQMMGSDISVNNDNKTININTCIKYDQLICPVCYELAGGKFGSIVVCGNGHYTCDTCITDGEYHRCPTCHDVFISIDPVITNVVRSISKTCVYECKYTTLSDVDLTEHIANCDHRPSPCIWCKYPVTIYDYKIHMMTKCAGLQNTLPTQPYPHLTNILIQMIMSTDTKCDKYEHKQYDYDGVIYLLPNNRAMVVDTNYIYMSFVIIDFNVGGANGIKLPIPHTLKFTNGCTLTIYIPIMHICDLHKYERLPHLPFEQLKTITYFNDAGNKYNPISSNLYTWSVFNKSDNTWLKCTISSLNDDKYEPTVIAVVNGISELITLNTLGLSRFRHDMLRLIPFK